MTPRPSRPPNLSRAEGGRDQMPRHHGGPRGLGPGDRRPLPGPCVQWRGLGLAGWAGPRDVTPACAPDAAPAAGFPFPAPPLPSAPSVGCGPPLSSFPRWAASPALPSQKHPLARCPHHRVPSPLSVPPWRPLLAPRALFPTCRSRSSHTLGRECVVALFRGRPCAAAGTLFCPETPLQLPRTRSCGSGSGRGARGQPMGLGRP